MRRTVTAHRPARCGGRATLMRRTSATWVHLRCSRPVPVGGDGHAERVAGSHCGGRDPVGVGTGGERRAEAAVVDAGRCARVGSGGWVVPDRGTCRRAEPCPAHGDAALACPQRHAAQREGSAQLLAQGHGRARDARRLLHAARVCAARCHEGQLQVQAAARHREAEHAGAAAGDAPARPGHAAAGAGAHRHSRRRPQPAPAADRRELLLRHGGPLQERQPRQRQGQHRVRQPGRPRLRPDEEGLLPRR